MINIFKSLWCCKRSVVKVANEGSNSAQIIPTNTTEIKMARFEISARLKDDQGNVLWEMDQNNNNLDPVQVCDMQDLLVDGVQTPLRQLARTKAEAKVAATANSAPAA